MPLYEYKCERCQSVFEVIQKFSDSPLETHQGCGGTVARLLSSPALQFKGSGWYITDYARSGKGGGGGKSNGQAMSGAETATESKAESKAEAKPAAAESTKK